MQNEALTILTNYCVVKPGVSVSLSNPCIDKQLDDLIVGYCNG